MSSTYIILGDTTEEIIALQWMCNTPQHGRHLRLRIALTKSFIDHALKRDDPTNQEHIENILLENIDTGEILTIAGLIQKVDFVEYLTNYRHQYNTVLDCPQYFTGCGFDVL